jgi:hypothetical protein
MQNVPKKSQARLKKEIGNYIVEQTLQDVGDTKSPVTARPFRALSKKYKDYKKGLASPVPNLELKGKMLNQLKFKSTKTGIEIGIFDKKQAQKADNHNKFSGKSLKTKVPARKFIPKNGRDQYKKEIRKEVANIIKEFQVEETKKEES